LQSKIYYMSTFEKPIVVNLFAGPGTGKSTSAAQIFSELKWNGINCEMSLEFAKEKVWEESFATLDDQIYIFGKQLHKMRRLIGKVDVIITDSPLLFSLIYDEKQNQFFKDLVLDVNKEFDNYNIFLERRKGYAQAGRMQNEEGARELDAKILKMLKELEVPFVEFPATKNNITQISDTVTSMVNIKKNNEARIHICEDINKTDSGRIPNN
jgi:hypothetical protein